LVEKVTNHVNKINKLKEELSILEKTRIWGLNEGCS
jgi:hypothetical protein